MKSNRKRKSGKDILEKRRLKKAKQAAAAESRKRKGLVDADA